MNAPSNAVFGPVWEDIFETGGQIVGWSSGYDDKTFIRQAQSTGQFDTGGKAVPGRQSLYLFTCSAVDMLSTNPIPPETITMGSLGHLDTNGNLWVCTA